MKLKTILKISTPITMIGVMTPIITSCSSDSFDFEYGDDINCIEKETGENPTPYHSRKSIISAVKKHADRCNFPQVSVATLNSNLQSDEKAFQNCFFDLIASCTILGDDTGTPFSIKIKNWQKDFSTHTFNFYFEHNIELLQPKSLTATHFEYILINESVYISFGNGSPDLTFLKSYTYQDCKAVA